MIQVQINITDEFTGRYKAGDIAEVISKRRTPTDAHPGHYLVQLGKPCSFDGKGLSTKCFFHKSQVEEVDDDW